MELSKRPRRGSIRLMGMVVATALCAALIAAAPASAKVAEYSAQSPNASPDRNSAYLSFKIKSKKNQQTKKFNPVGVRKVDAIIYLTDGGCNVKSSIIYREEIPVSGRSFSISEADDNSTWEFSGRVPRNGLPKGKVRYTYTTTDENGNPLHCDTGYLDWTAKRLPWGTL